MTADGRALPRLDAVVFDFDGLMVDTERSTYDAVDAVFAAHGETLSVELWAGFVGTTDHPHWADILEEQLGRPIDRDRWVARRRADGVARARALPLLPGVADLLDSLAVAGVRLGLASSSRGGWVEGHLDHRGLSGRFEVVCTGDEVERTKPDPALYTLACRRLGVSPAATVAVEDSLHGVAAAKAAGMVAVAVPGTFMDPGDFGAADLVVGSCADLAAEVLAGLVASHHP